MDLLTAADEARAECQLAAGAVINVDTPEHPHHNRSAARRIRHALFSKVLDSGPPIVRAISQQASPDLTGPIEEGRTKVLGSTKQVVRLEGHEAARMQLHASSKGRPATSQINTEGMDLTDLEELISLLFPLRHWEIEVSVMTQDRGLSVVSGRTLFDLLRKFKTEDQQA